MPGNERIEAAAMTVGVTRRHELDAGTRTFYCDVLAALCEADVPFLVGGGYALDHYTHIGRSTKDLDLFVRPRDFARALDVLVQRGYDCERTFHWIGKVHCGDDLVDIIYSAVNGVPQVDDEWFAHGVAATVLGLPARLIPPEEFVWAKSFVMERERYDGADVMHLLHACGQNLNWQRLLARFDGHWRVLLSHLILFGFVYPCEQDRVPREVISELIGRLQDELAAPALGARVCQGPLLSWRQYLVDVEGWGYEDARIRGAYMTPDQIAEWTEAFRNA